MVGHEIVTRGVWWAGTATVMLATALAVGGLVYAIVLRGKIRRAPTWTGGETLESTYVSGVPVGPLRRVEVTGVDFYDTVEELPGIRGVYGMARRKLLDVYEDGSRVVFYFVDVLRRAHTGLLPLYVTWVVAGFLAVLYAIFRGRT
jgi:hypothetical protein